ncbi:Gliding motility-associated C-terminal domain-containing protein [Flavobacterium sp. 9R]|nr:Gliding motility-associated C-terminal domain-containing protein [Flavobacterium sp. 9R]
MLLVNQTTFAQKEAAVWYFGNFAGIDFNSGSPVSITNGKLFTNEGCTSISDNNGNILFYTDGSLVYNKQHQVMPNGNGLLGHRSSTQSAIIIPKPKNKFQYYIFTVDEPNPKNTDDTTLNDEDPPNNGLNYSLVDTRLDNGNGDIVISEKNIPLITYNVNDPEEVKYKCSEKITAVQHGDGESFWIVTHFKNNFYAFKISASGVIKNPIKSTTNLVPTGGYITNAIGYLKASPNGKKIAIANSSIKNTNETGPKGEIKRDTGNVVLYDFDSTTGQINNNITLISNINPYGVEFSAKSKKLYITTNNFDAQGVVLGSTLYQFDLKSSNIVNSKKAIINSSYVAGALQLGIDEKIYRSGYPILTDSYDKLSVINNPEADGSNCNYIQDAISLKVPTRVRLGLPPFITSLFLYSFNYEFNCFGDNTLFYFNTNEKVDQVIWDFGDGSTSSDTNAYHIYKNAGVYNVKLTKIINGEQREPLEKKVTIYESPIISAKPIVLAECDSNDEFPEDEKTTFSLSSANYELTLNNNDYEVYFYHSTTEAIADSQNINALPNDYKNTQQDEILIAKVTQPNSNCYSLGSIILHVDKNIELLPSPFYSCTLSEDKANFNINNIKEHIKKELNLPASVVLFLYQNNKDFQLRTNPLNGDFLSTNTTLFIRAENDSKCYGSGKITISTMAVPKIKASETVYICKNNPNLVALGTGIVNLNEANNYSYLWSTKETSPTIETKKTGIYTLTLTNLSGCSSTITYEVLYSSLAKIDNITIDETENSNNVVVTLNDPQKYRYSIQLEGGNILPFQNTPFFQNVPGGIHELIIENLDGCGSVKKEIIIINFPKFFTPNGDGYNDYWNVKGTNTAANSKSVIRIFDRYGKLLKQIFPNSNGWDGTFNGQALPSDDYWYTVVLEDGREIKGHFALKR